MKTCDEKISSLIFVILFKRFLGYRDLQQLKRRRKMNEVKFLVKYLGLWNPKFTVQICETERLTQAEYLFYKLSIDYLYQNVCIWYRIIGEGIGYVCWRGVSRGSKKAVGTRVGLLGIKKLPSSLFPGDLLLWREKTNGRPTLNKKKRMDSERPVVPQNSRIDHSPGNSTSTVICSVFTSCKSRMSSMVHWWAAKWLTESLLAG